MKISIKYGFRVVFSNDCAASPDAIMRAKLEKQVRFKFMQRFIDFSVCELSVYR